MSNRHWAHAAKLIRFEWTIEFKRQQKRSKRFFPFLSKGGVAKWREPNAKRPIGVNQACERA